MALIFAELMATLNYTNYIAQGGDWGAMIRLMLASRHTRLHQVGAHLVWCGGTAARRWRWWTATALPFTSTSRAEVSDTLPPSSSGSVLLLSRVVSRRRVPAVPQGRAGVPEHGPDHAAALAHVRRDRLRNLQVSAALLRMSCCLCAAGVLLVPCMPLHGASN